MIDGKPIEIHHHGMEVMRRLPNGEWVFFIDHPWGADSSWAVDRPPHTENDARHARDWGYEPEWTLARGVADYAWLKTQEAQALGAQETMVVDL